MYVRYQHSKITHLIFRFPYFRIQTPTFRSSKKKGRETAIIGFNRRKKHRTSEEERHEMLGTVAPRQSAIPTLLPHPLFRAHAHTYTRAQTPLHRSSSRKICDMCGARVLQSRPFGLGYKLHRVCSSPTLTQPDDRRAGRQEERSWHR